MSKKSFTSAAYKNTLQNGGTKEQAKEVQKQAGETFENQRSHRHFGGGKGSLRESDFNSSLNGNGTDWHTSEDL